MRRVALVAMLAVAASTAAAQGPIGMPDYDVERHCKRQASIMGGGDFWLNACLVQEQEAYDQLKARWSEIWADPNVMRQCRQQASLFGASYFGRMSPRHISLPCGEVDDAERIKEAALQVMAAGYRGGSTDERIAVAHT